MVKRRNFADQFKGKGALRGDKALQEIAAKPEPV